MRTTFLAGIFALALASAFGGCGGDGGDFDLDTCGNGVLDSGEACDDGNLADTDGCLSTCQPNVCGDGFVDRTIGECEREFEPECTAFGFTSGTVVCTATCTADTSGCRNGGPTPVATPAPSNTGSSGATPTPAGPTATPTAQPTPVGAVCSGSESIVVTLSLDGEVDSAVLKTAYPPSVNLPGSLIDSSVKDRVEFTGSGLTAVNDFDENEDLTDETLTTGLVGSDVLPAGVFATITFDCVGGEPVPSAADFTCTVTSASLNGADVSPICTVAIQ